jgi:hypothetical protein
MAATQTAPATPLYLRTYTHRDIVAGAVVYTLSAGFVTIKRAAPASTYLACHFGHRMTLSGRSARNGKTVTCALHSDGRIR